LLTFQAYSQTENKELIKRKILIFPFYNENEIKEYNYLENTIRDALRAKLQVKNLFLFANFNEIDEKIKNIQRKDLVYNDDTIIRTALKLGADVVLTGKYIIIKDKIMIIANSIDVLQKQSVISATVSGDTGIEIFSLIDNLSLNMTDKISQSFPKLEKSILEQLVEKQQKQHNITDEEEKIAAKIENEKKEDIKEINKKKPDYIKFRNCLGTGIGLTSGGLLCAIIGVIPLAVGFSMYDLVDASTAGSFFIDGTNAAIGVGAAFLSVGGIMLIIGIIMYPVAAHFYQKWKASLSSSELKIKPVFEFKNDIYTLGFAIKM